MRTGVRVVEAIEERRNLRDGAVHGVGFVTSSAAFPRPCCPTRGRAVWDRVVILFDIGGNVPQHVLRGVAVRLRNLGGQRGG